VRIVFDDGTQEPRNSNPADQPEISTLHDLIDSCFVQTCTTMYRRLAIKKFPPWYVYDESPDWSLLILAAQHGNLGYLNEVMGVYRQHAGGYWSRLSTVERSRRVIRFYEVLQTHLAAPYRSRVEQALARQREALASEEEAIRRREGTM
jgi:hypothetical protein